MFTSASVSLSVPPEMATCASFLSQTGVRTITTGWPSARRLGETHKLRIFESKYPTAGSPSQCQPVSVQITASHNIEFSLSDASLPRNSADIVEVARNVKLEVPNTLKTSSEITQRLVLADIDPGTAKVAISIVGPFLSAFGFLFIIRIVMSWFPKLPVGKFPYVIAYAPTEPLLIPTRKLIPPLGGVDVTPVVWFGLLSFLNEILVGPQGLLVLLSQQVS